MNGDAGLIFDVLRLDAAFIYTPRISPFNGL